VFVSINKEASGKSDKDKRMVEVRKLLNHLQNKEKSRNQPWKSSVLLMALDENMQMEANPVFNTCLLHYCK